MREEVRILLVTSSVILSLLMVSLMLPTLVKSILGAPGALEGRVWIRVKVLLLWQEVLLWEHLYLFFF